MSAPRGGGDSGADRYIQNGLLFQLDGLDKGNDPTVWKDRKGMATFPFNEHFVSANVGGVLKGTGESVCLEDYSGMVPFPFNDSTFEIVFIPDENNSYSVSIVFCAPNGSSYNQQTRDGVRLGFYKNYFLTGNYALERFGFRTDSSFRVSSSIAGAALYNGTVATKDINDAFYGTRNNFVLGQIKDSSSGQLLAVRCYNRQLTYEEMLFNQKIDNERFNLGLSI